MTKPMQVTLDMTFPSRNRGGSGVYAHELLAALRMRQDVAPHAIALNGTGLAKTLPWLLRGAGRAAGRAPLVHCPAFVAPWHLPGQFVLTVHDVSTLLFPEDHPLEWRAYMRMLLPGRAKAAAVVVTGTEYTKDEIVRHLGVKAERVAVTPYGVGSRFASPRSPRKQNVSSRPLLLFPGAPVRRKNLELVLQGLAESPQDSILRQARLAISGATADRFPAHQARIRELGLEDRVEWLGRVPAEDMPTLYTEADLVVYPSLHEGFGFPALEAMAGGAPVLASNAACLPEVLGDAAMLVDPHSASEFVAAAEALLANAGLRCDMVAKGRARAAGYTWQRCAELTVDVYREVLGRR